MDAQNRMQLVEIEEQVAVEQNHDDTVKEVAESTTLDADQDLSACLLGYTCHALEGMYEMYCKHGTQLGFSVSKSTTRLRADNKVCEKYYVCSCHGFQKHRNTSETVEEGGNSDIKKRKRKTHATRNGCNASIRVKLNDEGLYEVVGHVIAHNDELTKPQLRHHMRSERSITKEKSEVIKTMSSAGIMPVDSYNYMCEYAGREEVVGHTIKDHYNFVTHLKMIAIEGGDAQSLIDLLSQKNIEEPDFFYRVRLDDNGRLAHIFWRDSRMKEDYGFYGDVMVFDTTYRTNRYNLICAPFVGINNHWKNVMFGCAFLSDEKVESFVWLFETFKKSMQGQTPDSIFTDQDQAMTNAIEKVFPEARHRLCLWHIYKNAVSHFGSLKRDPTFQEAFNNCLKKCSTEEEFYACWNEMITKYGLQNEPWFNRLFEIREKWCTTLSKDYFSAGILSSQRSESTNNAIGFKANKTTSLTEFYNIFDKTVKRWRSREIANEYTSRKIIPDPNVCMNSLLKHGIETYTPTLFADFENEFNKAMSSVARIIQKVESTMIYEVAIDENKKNKHTVCYTPEDEFFTCTCKRFEEIKMLCYHIIRIMHMHSILKIPRHHIAIRWTKVARDKMWDDLQELEDSSKKKQSTMPWRHMMAKKYYNLLLRCEENQEARKMLENGLERDLAESKKLLPECTDKTNDSTSTSASSSRQLVLDPERAKTKGRSKRLKGYFERRKSNTTSTATSSVVNKEFGSATPNPRVI